MSEWKTYTPMDGLTTPSKIHTWTKTDIINVVYYLMTRINKMNIQNNISDIVSHTQTKQPGHDDFVVRYSRMITLEMMGITNPKAYENRHQLTIDKQGIEKKPETLDFNKKLKNEEYNQDADQLKILEDRYKVGGTPAPHQTGSDTMFSPPFMRGDIDGVAY